MKKIVSGLWVCGVMGLGGVGEDEEERENGMVWVGGREGFRMGWKKGDFVLKGYVLVERSGKLNWYEDEGVEKGYNEENVGK